MTFKIIEGDTAVVAQGGVYRQCDLYEWDGKLFARFGTGFVRIKADGSTSKDGVQVQHMMIDAPLFRDRFGRLCVSDGEGRSQIAESPLLLPSE